MVSGPPRLLTEQRPPTGRQSRRRALYVRLAMPAVLVGLATGAASCGSPGAPRAVPTTPSAASRTTPSAVSTTTSLPPTRAAAIKPALPPRAEVLLSVRGEGSRRLRLPAAASRAGLAISFYWTCVESANTQFGQAFALGAADTLFAKSGCGDGPTFGASPPPSTPTPITSVTISAAQSTSYWLEVVIGRLGGSGGTPSSATQNA